jgi:subtilisin family serine protease
MKHRIILSLFLLSLSAGAAFGGDGNIQRVDRPVPDRYMVLLAEDFPATEHAAALAGQARGRLVHVYEHVLNGFSIQANEHAAAALAHNPAVAEVHEVGYVYGGETQLNPPEGLDRIDQTTLDLNNSFLHNYDGAGVYIYIVDSGVNPIADLAGRIVENRSFLTQNGIPVTATNDCRGHGTAVASVAAGTTYGVAKGAWIVNVRVLDCNGRGSWDDFARALDHIAGVKATTGRSVVANASIFGSLWGPADDAVRRLVAANVPIALISGNNDASFIDANCRANAAYCSPGRVGAGLAGAMTTGATVPATDYVTGYTIQGSVIDIFAPSDTLAVWGDGGVYLVGGTSFAAPHVAGVMAKHLQTNPLLSAAQIEDSVRAQASTPSNAFLPELVHGRTLGSPDRLLFSLFRRRRACCTSTQ